MAADEIAATLERAGVTTLATADPNRARSLLDDRRVDCVVTELRFDGANDETPPETDPGHPGLALLDTLRERNPTLPVVVYTGADLGCLDPTAPTTATTSKPTPPTTTTRSAAGTDEHGARIPSVRPPRGRSHLVFLVRSRVVRLAIERLLLLSAGPSLLTGRSLLAGLLRRVRIGHCRGSRRWVTRFAGFP
jgi:hypothetical protein